MDRLYKLIKSKSSKKKLLIGLLLVLTVNLLLFPNVPKWMGVNDFSTEHVLDLKFGYSVDETHFALESMGLEGRKAYLLIETIVDIPYAIVYGLFYAALLILFFEKSRNKRVKNVFIIPIIAGVLDIIENIALIPLVINFPEINTLIAGLANIFTILKWLFAVTSILLLIIGLVYFLLNRNEKKTNLTAFKRY